MGICFADIKKPACITFKFTKEWLNYIWNISCNCSSAFHQPPLAHLILRLLLSVNSDLLWNKEMRQVYTKHRGGGGGSVLHVPSKLNMLQFFLFIAIKPFYSHNLSWQEWHSLLYGKMGLWSPKKEQFAFWKTKNMGQRLKTYTALNQSAYDK